MGLNNAVVDVLQRLGAGNQLIDLEWQQLLDSELADSRQAQAYGITAANGLAKLKERSRLFHQVCAQVQPELGENRQILWNLWLPLALKIAALKTLGRPLVQGILGVQGTGKTTLANALRLILGYLGYTTLTFSIDDLYKPYAARVQLRQQDPRFLWRGPPGTHDVELGIQVLDQCRQPHRQAPILVPRFDKSAHNGAGDRTEPERIEPPDIILFEGWFVGVRPVAESVFNEPLPPIVTAADRQFARDCHERLKAYLPLWERLDSLFVLDPVDYRLSKQWRQEAEQKMIAAGHSGMSKAEIEEFVKYFWRSLHPELFIAPLLGRPDLVDLVIEINADHSLNRVYQPSAPLN